MKKQTNVRKEPQQARSVRVVEAILEASTRILEREGVAAFTTGRIAAAAGVSVGSLYQYFPNKQSILVRLQQREWGETSALLESILRDTRLAPAERLRRSMREFFRTERAEAPLVRAIEHTATALDEDFELTEHRARGYPALSKLIGELAPGATPTQRKHAAELYKATKSALGRHFADTVTSQAELDMWADAVADMLLAYLRTLPRKRSRK